MKKAISLVMFLTIVFTINGRAQNQTNMYFSGEMNGWGATSMEYRLLGVPTWKTTIESDGDDNSSDYKFRDSDLNWDNPWGAGSTTAIDNLATFYSLGDNGNFNETNLKHYTFIWVDLPDGTNSYGYVLETSSEPVTITDVSQSPEVNSVDENDDVVVTTETNTIPCDEEHIYVRYTTDNWTSSSLEELDFGDPRTSIGTATIPSQNSAEKSTSYYVFSTTLLNPTSSYDEMTINYDNNNNTNYAYTTLHSTTNNGDWHTPTTWTSGVVPAIDDDVIISHDVTITAASEINNITVESGASVEYDASANHTIHGSVLVYGNARVNNNNFIHVEGWMWVLFTGDLTIRAGGELTVDGTTTNNGAFTIESNSTSTGSFIPTGALTGSNDITVERYVGSWTDDTHGWHLLSSPVASQAIQPDFVPNTPTVNEDFYSWNEVSDLWINSESSTGVWNTSFENDFEVSKGYLVAYGSATSTSSTFSGTLNNSDVPVSGLTYTTATHTGWNLLGNPYASALYWNKTGWNLNNIDANAKVWVESSASYTDISAVTGILPAMQGFMVHVTSAGTGSLNIDADDRTHDSQNWYKNVATNKITLTAYDTEGNTAQESNIIINENATSGFDSEYDSWFLKGYAPQFYSVIDGGTLSTNSLPEISAETRIPMSFIKNSSSTYYIEVEGINTLNPQETVYLTDLKTNHTQILNDNPVYNFSSEEGDITERFIVHFGPLSIDNLITSEHISVISANGIVEIKSNKPVDAEINIYSISGQLIGTTNLNNECSTAIEISTYKGAAVVSTITSGQIHNKKVIIW